MAKKTPKTLYPNKAEQTYARNLQKHFRALGSYILSEFDSLAKEIDSEAEMRSVRGDININQRINNLMKKIKKNALGYVDEKEVGKDAARFLKNVNAVNKSNTSTQIGARGINPVASEPWLSAFMNQKIKENVGYITTIRSETLEKVEEIITESVNDGKSSVDIRKQLAERVGISENRAKFIARDQTGSVLGQLNAARHTENGIRAYRWRDSDDLAVRDSHKERDGKIFFYADGEMLPGEDYNCRCVAEPVFDEELVELGLLDPSEVSSMPDASEIPEEPDNQEVTKMWNKEAAQMAMEKTNMAKNVGEENYNNFINHLSEVENQRIQSLFEIFSEDVSFQKIKNVRAHASKSLVQLSQENFTGGKSNKPFQTVYHEIGHAIDSLGLKKITGNESVATGKIIKRKILRKTVEVEEKIHRISGLPDYKLKETINRDIWEYVNGKVLPTFEDLGEKPRKKAEKEAYENRRSEIFTTSRKNFSDFEKRMIELYGKANETIGAISDIYESTPYSQSSYPFGVGHGKDYYKSAGTAETEFFAHVMESITTNQESYSLISEIFPNAVKVWENIVDDLIKGVKKDV